MTELAYQLEVKADGRVQLPAELRKHLQLKTGSQLLIRVQDSGHAELVTLGALAAELRGYFADDGPPMSDELIQDRRLDAAREEQS